MTTTSKTPDLLPCPFCGSKHVYLNNSPSFSRVRCHRCYCDGSGVDGNEKTRSMMEEEAIAAWNTRAELAEKDREIERLKKEIKELELAQRETARRLPI